MVARKKKEKDFTPGRRVKMCTCDQAVCVCVCLCEWAQLAAEMRPQASWREEQPHEKEPVGHGEVILTPF